MSGFADILDMLKYIPLSELLYEWQLIKDSGGDPVYKKALEIEIARRTKNKI